MKGDQGQAIASQNKLSRDELVGKDVVITGGQYKGHRGRVTFADDHQAIVELSSQCKKIPIDKQLVQKLDKEDNQNNAQVGAYGGRSQYGGASVYGGATVYEGGKTPMAGHATPSYYPQSTWGNGNEFDKDVTPFQQPQYSNYVDPTPGHHRPDGWVKQE